MASKTVYIFFHSASACLEFADKNAERVLHMGFGAFDPINDETKHGTTEDEDCTNKSRWFVRMTLNDGAAFLSESSAIPPISSRKRRGGV